jgi:histone deacetylase complex regulatory component SIN3
VLQRGHAMEHQYTERSETLEKELGDQFDGIEDAVIVALYSTEHTNSMIENLNERARRHLYYRQ